MLDIDLFLESTPRTRVARSPTVVLKKDDILLDTPPKPKVKAPQYIEYDFQEDFIYD